MHGGEKSDNYGEVNGVITYDFLHGMGRCNPQTAFREITAVMQRFAKPSVPTGAGFLLDLAADDNPVLNAAYDDLCRIYGTGHKTSRGYHIDGRMSRAFQWPLEQGQVEGALSHAAELHQRHSILVERSGVQVWWTFRFVDPETKAELPYQEFVPVLDIRRPDKGSQVALTLRRTAAASLWLFFPYKEPSPEFLAYARGFQSALPFKLSPKHWRKWRRNDKGEWEPRKFSPLPT